MAGEVSDFGVTHISIGGDNTRPWPEKQKFSVVYKGLVFEFYQRNFDSGWRVDYPMHINLSDEQASMAFTLLFRAGFEPEVDRIGRVIKWVRPRSRPLWPDTVESFK